MIYTSDTGPDFHFGLNLDSKTAKDLYVKSFRCAKSEGGTALKRNFALVIALVGVFWTPTAIAQVEPDDWRDSGESDSREGLCPEALFRRATARVWPAGPGIMGPQRFAAASCGHLHRPYTAEQCDSLFPG